MLYWLSGETKRLLAEMAAGVIGYNAVLLLAAVLILPRLSYPVVPVLKGVCIGAAGAVMMLVHMADTIEKALQSGDPGYAKRITIVQSLLRRVAFIAAMGFFWYVLKADLLAMVAGAMGMKAGAYLQPLVHRLSGAGDEPYAKTVTAPDGLCTRENPPEMPDDEPADGETPQYEERRT